MEEIFLTEKMASWTIDSNKLNYKIQPKRNLDALFREYLSHRVRLLYAQHKKFILPEQWSFNKNDIEFSFFSDDILVQAKQGPTHALYKDFESLRDNEIIPALKTFFKCTKEGIFGFAPFFPVMAKWIAPVSYLTRIASDESQQNEDFIHLKAWITRQEELYSQIISKEQKKYLDSLVEYILKGDTENVENLLNKGRIQETGSFLDLLTEAELFWKVRQVYRYRILKKEDAKIYGDIRKNVFVLEVNNTYPDPHFGKIKRPTMQELWDHLMENSHTSRVLRITREIPNPLDKFRKDAEGQIFVDWIRVHADQQIIFIKVSRSVIPKKGFLYVYDYGDVDQFNKKRRNIAYARDHPILQHYLAQEPLIDVPVWKNKWIREDLVEKILHNQGLFAVQGPPGTGKTYLATEIVVEYLVSRPDSKLLICSKEHQALNQILGKITTELKNKQISFRAYRSLSQYRILRDNAEEKIKPYLQNAVLRDFESYQWDSHSIMWSQAHESYSQEYDLRNRSLAEKSANLYFCTTMDSTFLRILHKQSYDLVVIEEAGKCYPSELFHVLALGQNILMIGDQNQLPPFKIKETEEAIRVWEFFFQKAKQNPRYDEEMRKRYGFRYEIIREYFKCNGALSEKTFKWLKPFETLFNLMLVEKKHILDEEYRMEKDLSDIIGRVFYQREFKYKKEPSKPLEGVIPIPYDLPLLWIDTPHTLDNSDAGEDPEKIGQRVNHYELELLLLYLRRLKPIRKIDMVLLTPYNNQKDLFLETPELKEECAKLSDRKFEEMIRTIDEYQGDEADLTILSLVRNNVLGSSSSWGFMTEAARLNVMFSRTKSRQVIFGCSEHIVRNKEEERNKYLVDFYFEYKKIAKFISAEEFRKNEPKT